MIKIFEIIKMSLAKNSKTKAYFNFKYEGLTVSSASLYVTNDGELAVAMPSKKTQAGKIVSVCFFSRHENSKQKALFLLAKARYEELLEEQAKQEAEER